MTWNLGLLFHIRNIHLWPITLPTRKLTYAQKRGKVKLGRNSILKDALYVPQLNCHLITISKLLKDAKDIYMVSFTASACAIQDHLSKIFIRASEENDGLYFF